MKDFTIFSEQDGELKAYYASNNGRLDLPPYFRSIGISSLNAVSP